MFELDPENKRQIHFGFELTHLMEKCKIYFLQPFAVERSYGIPYSEIGFSLKQTFVSNDVLQDLSSMTEIER